MQDENLGREGLLAELEGLRHRVAELESENTCLQKQSLSGVQEPVETIPGSADALCLPVEPGAAPGQEDYRSLLQAASEAICIIQDGVLKFANPAGTELTGYTNEKLT